MPSTGNSLKNYSGSSSPSSSKNARLPSPFPSNEHKEPPISNIPPELLLVNTPDELLIPQTLQQRDIPSNSTELPTFSSRLGSTFSNSSTSLPRTPSFTSSGLKRPIYSGRARSAQNLYTSSPTIPENDYISHSTLPSLPKFSSINQNSSLDDHLLKNSSTSVPQVVVSSLPAHNQPFVSLADDKRRKRAFSLEKDATKQISLNIFDHGDYGIDVDDEDGDDQDDANITATITSYSNDPNTKSFHIDSKANKENPKVESPPSGKPKNKRQVVFYDIGMDEDDNATDNDEHESNAYNTEHYDSNSHNSHVQLDLHPQELDDPNVLSDVMSPSEVESDIDNEKIQDSYGSKQDPNKKKTVNIVGNKHTSTVYEESKENSPSPQIRSTSSIDSDHGADNLFSRIVNFNIFNKGNTNSNNDENIHGDAEERNIGHDHDHNNKKDFELDFFSSDHPIKFLRRTTSNEFDSDPDDSNDSEVEEHEKNKQKEIDLLKAQLENVLNGGINPKVSKVSKVKGIFSAKSPGNASKNNLEVNDNNTTKKHIKKSSIGASASLSNSSSRTSLSDYFYTTNNKAKLNNVNGSTNGFSYSDDYVPPPDKVQEGFLSTMLKLSQLKNENSLYDDGSLAGTSDDLSKMTSTTGSSIADFGESNHISAVKSASNLLKLNIPNFKSTMTKEKRSQLRNRNLRKNSRKKLEAKITVHLANLVQKKLFILTMCNALMLYGAPPHRLEEYMVMTSRVLEIDGLFMYFPGCMIVSFNDPSSKTSEVQLVRNKEGVNLSKLHDTHLIYKAVVHDLIAVDDASIGLKKLMDSNPLYPPWACVLLYGLGSVSVCPLFNGYWADLPICFLIGLCVGTLQFYIAPKSAAYTNIFEVVASIVVSFLARAIGSINGGKTFCFAALTQASLALILPGFIILTGSLEMQSRNIINGAVRMFYAIIYSLFLSFGITIGAAIYGWIDKEATSNQTCSFNTPISPWYRFLFIPLFSIVLALINQASWKQLPAMVGVSCVGYVVSYFSSLHFTNSSEFTSCLAAVVIGFAGNLYSRLYKGLAISAMLPAIFLQVPSGIASQSSLLAGVNSANQIVSSLNNTASSTSTSGETNSLSFGMSMIQVAIGISVGLFTASILVYPFGKKRTGMFTM